MGREQRRGRRVVCRLLQIRPWEGTQPMTMTATKPMNFLRSRMRRIISARLRAVLAPLSFAMITASVAGAATEKVIHTFNAYGNGALPQSSLVADAAGNLYGTTSTGGSANAGVVFELTPTSSGKWKQRILHDFQGGTDRG